MEGFYYDDEFEWFQFESPAEITIRIFNAFDMRNAIPSGVESWRDELDQLLQNRRNHVYTMSGVDKTFYAKMYYVGLEYENASLVKIPRERARFRAAGLQGPRRSQPTVQPPDLNESQELRAVPRSRTRNSRTLKYQVGDVALFPTTSGWRCGVITKIHQDGIVDYHLLEQKASRTLPSNIHVNFYVVEHQHSLRLDNAPDKLAELRQAQETEASNREAEFR